MATAKKPLAGLGKKVTTPSRDYSVGPKAETEEQALARADKLAEQLGQAADIAKVSPPPPPKPAPAPKPKLQPPSTPITNAYQLQGFLKSDFAKEIGFDKYYDLQKSLSTSVGPYFQQEFDNRLVKEAENARQNPVPFAKKALTDAAFFNVRSSYYGQTDTAKKYADDANLYIKFLLENDVTPTDVKNLIDTGQSNYVAALQADIKDKQFLDTVFNVAANFALPVVTGPMNQYAFAALKATTEIMQGVNPATAIKNGMINLGVNEIADYLQEIKGLSKDSIVNSIVTNAATNYISAKAQGLDAKTAAMAGAAGGAVSGALLKATDSRAISRAAGEYTQGLAAGMTPEMSMMQALAGFADEEIVEARKKVAREAVLKSALIKPETPAQDQVIEAFSQPKSPGVGTQIGVPTASTEVDLDTGRVLISGTGDDVLSKPVIPTASQTTQDILDVITTRTPTTPVPMVETPASATKALFGLGTPDPTSPYAAYLGGSTGALNPGWYAMLAVDGNVPTAVVISELETFKTTAKSAEQIKAVDDAIQKVKDVQIQSVINKDTPQNVVRQVYAEDLNNAKSVVNQAEKTITSASGGALDALPKIDVVAPPGEFGADLIRPTTPSRDTDILNLTGLRPAITPPSAVSVTTPTLPDIRIPTAPTAPTAPTPPAAPTQPTQPSAPVTPPAPAQPPATDQMLPEVDVTGDRDRDILNLTGLTRPTTPTTPTTPQEPPKPSLPEVEVVGEPLEKEPAELKPDTEAETKPTKPPVEEEPGTKPTRPILLSLLNLPTAYLGDRPGEMRPGTAALAQALGVGDPGALYLGKKGKERKPVWNVESLKLKDELGGNYG